MEMHYFKPSPYGGFTNDLREVSLEEIRTKKFDTVMGDMYSKYIVMAMSCNIAATVYDFVLFTDDIAECEKVAENWMNVKSHPINKEKVMQNHYFVTVIDASNEKEIAYGDCWQATNDGEPQSPWHKYSNC